MKMTGAQILMECLLEMDVDTIFGYPGGAILNVYDELYRYKDKIRHILTSHEQGAAHAADGYARASGKVGVCFATSGPGATNLVTGIATAYMDSVPVVAITCNVAKPLLGKDSFQEVDIAGITMPITKHNFIVKDVEYLAETIRRAFKIAREGRPGPVLVDITKDATGNSCDFKPLTKTQREKAKVLVKSHPEIDKKSIDTVLRLIEKSKKPMIFAGGGVVISEASQKLLTFAEKIDAPVCDSLMGKGSFPGNHELYTGMLGMHGTKTSNYAVSECDLLIACGVRFSDRVTGNAKKFASHAKIVHFDIDPAEINKNIFTDASIIGDVGDILDALNEKLTQKDHKDWIRHVFDYKARFPMTVPQTKGLNGPQIVEEIYRQTKGEAVICTEVGQHQMWAAQYYRYTKPRTFLSSGGLGTMGYGLGACIGAQIARPDKQVINIAGDGCFRMNLIELMTAAREKLPIIVVVVDNRVLGMVRQWQTLFYNKRYSATVLDEETDFVKIAEGMGAKAKEVKDGKEFSEALKEALASKVPYVIDCRIDCDEKVWPMVAPGASIEEVFTEEDLKEKES